MHNSQVTSKEISKNCLACGYAGRLQKGVCMQCWEWSKIGHNIDSTKKLLKEVE